LRRCSAASIWAENATLLSGKVWDYVQVPQPEFDKLQPRQYADLLVLIPLLCA
jgi:hypothetical protein